MNKLLLMLVVVLAVGVNLSKAADFNFTYAKLNDREKNLVARLLHYAIVETYKFQAPEQLAGIASLVQDHLEKVYEEVENQQNLVEPLLELVKKQALKEARSAISVATPLDVKEDKRPETPAEIKTALEAGVKAVRELLMNYYSAIYSNLKVKSSHDGKKLSLPEPAQLAKHLNTIELLK